MVERLLQVVTEYEERLRRNDYVPRLSYGRWMVRDDGGPNRYFLMYLFSEQSMATEFFFRHLRYQVRPRSILIIFRLEV